MIPEVRCAMNNQNRSIRCRRGEVKGSADPTPKNRAQGGLIFGVRNGVLHLRSTELISAAMAHLTEWEKRYLYFLNFELSRRFFLTEMC
jgi:hypothetical protein